MAIPLNTETDSMPMPLIISEMLHSKSFVYRMLVISPRNAHPKQLVVEFATFYKRRRFLILQYRKNGRASSNSNNIQCVMFYFIGPHLII